MHNFIHATFVQAVKATINNAEPMCVTLGKKIKVLSANLVKLSISFASGASQKVWCHVVPEISALVILAMD